MAFGHQLPPDAVFRSEYPLRETDAILRIARAAEAADATDAPPAGSALSRDSKG